MSDSGLSIIALRKRDYELVKGTFGKNAADEKKHKLWTCLDISEVRIVGCGKSKLNCSAVIISSGISWVGVVIYLYRSYG